MVRILACSQIVKPTCLFRTTLDLHDRSYSRVRTLIRQTQERGIGVVTTWEVVVETLTLLRYHHSYLGRLALVRQVLPTLNLVSPDETERQRL